MDLPFSLTRKVTDGCMSLSEQDLHAIRSYLGRFEGKDVQVKFSRPRKERSPSQNRYYWGVVLKMISEQTGHTSEEIHMYTKQAFLPRVFFKFGEEEMELRKSSAELTSIEFEQYLERIRAWAGTTLGLGIPLPGGDM